MAKKKAAKLSEVVAEALRLATAIHEYWEAELPKVHPDYPMVRPDDPPETPPKEAKQLKAFLKNQPEEFAFQLALVVYLGRGDFDARDLASQYEALKDRFETGGAVISELTQKAQLSEYLREGVEELKRNRLDIDSLPLLATSQK